MSDIGLLAKTVQVLDNVPSFKAKSDLTSKCLFMEFEGVLAELMGEEALDECPLLILISLMAL